MLGEFEYLLLTAAVSLGKDAYGAAIRREIEDATGKPCSIGALYTTLDRLQAKGFVKTWTGDSTPLRGKGILSRCYVCEPRRFMGKPMSRNPTMARALWYLVDVASRMLDASECEAVRGDFEEAGESCGRALRGVLSLVILRQTGYLMDWHPALTLAWLALPLAILLSLVSERTADGSAIYIWLYVNNWDWTILKNPGYWRELAEIASSILLSYLALACWAWTAGFLMRFSSRRPIWLIGGVFFAVFICVGFWGVPHSLGHIVVVQRGRDFHNNAIVFANTFYRQVFPLAVEFILVALPAWWGMCQSFPMGEFPRVRKVVLLICISATIASLLTQSLEWWQFRIWAMYPLRLPRLPSLLPLALVGPISYLLSSWILHHRNRPILRV